jgi:uncharacterized heparinase superfamily protein
MQIPNHLETNPSPVATNLATLRSSLGSETRDRYRGGLAELVDGRLSFIGRSITVDDMGAFDWDPPAARQFPAMWRLHLQALEPVTWLILGYTPDEASGDLFETVRRLVVSWDESISVGGQGYLRRGWTPHAVSLRTLALSRLFVWLPDRSTEFAARVRRLAFKNALFLENHIEHDVGGNHLAENGVALLLAGTLFPEDGDRWFRTGRAVLEDCADEQFLEDGGHFERSPMYHTLVTQRYLTATDLLAIRGRDSEQIPETAAAATQFLESLAPPDGCVPLLNDAAFEEFLSLEDCLAYASAVGLDDAYDTAASTLDSSGYYWLGDGADRMLIDGGSVGPPHLPGHSHNDMLSVLLWVDGERILTDTGAADYVANADRRYVRGVAAHNTVQVADTEPIPVGGKYLLGRRCMPEATVSREGEVDRFIGSYRRDRGPSTLYRHQRTVVSGDEWWLIVDQVDGSTDAPVRARFHFHPEVTLRESGTGYTFQRETAEGQVRPFGTVSTERVRTPYFPRFGERRERESLQLEYDRPAVAKGLLVTTAGTEAGEFEGDTGRIHAVINRVSHTFEFSNGDNETARGR